VKGCRASRQALKELAEASLFAAEALQRSNALTLYSRKRAFAPVTRSSLPFNNS
jgi:hypothetical protein